MLKKHLKYDLIKKLGHLIVLVGLFSCAQRAVLTGGDKDVSPPEIISTLPENQSVNFASTEIVVEFDEFVRLVNLQNQLIVSPLMVEKPEVMIKGKKMKISLPQTLEANTTYSINFGDAIVDITESNVYPNYKYVFSTGNYIDSLAYSGKVLNAENLKPVAGIFVMLYNKNELELPIKERPNYLTKTKEDGSFIVANVAKGTYKVFALDDINGNYLYDLPNEQVAYFNNPIKLDSNLLGATLFSFIKESELQFVKKIGNQQYGQITVEFNNPVKLAELLTTSGDAYAVVAKEQSKDNKKHVFWLSQEIGVEEYSIIVKADRQIIDTVRIDMISKDEFKDSILALRNNVTTLFDINKKIEITAGHPISEITKEKIHLFEDNVLTNFSLGIDSLLPLSFELIYPFKENTEYKLLIEPKAITSIYQLKNDTLISTFKTKKMEDYGSLKFTVTPNFKENYIFQLIQKNEIIEEYCDVNIKIFNLSYLKPGEYQVKLIIDNNTNKIWDTGNYQLNIQPERVVIYQDKITIRENWDNEIQWNIKL